MGGPLRGRLRLYNQAIDACARRGLVGVILTELLPAMMQTGKRSLGEEEGAQPDTWSFNLALRACTVCVSNEREGAGHVEKRKRSHTHTHTHKLMKQ